MGLHPDSFEWALSPGDTFTAPEAVTVHSTAGLGDMSETFHRLYRTRLARGEWRDRSRPVLLNNWEGTYFDFDEERLVAIATVARDLGVELFVLDDGWFGRRDSDDRSLGDWIVDRRKLPNGLEGLVERITALGIAFGIWIEPEMVNADSDLFRAHPDWAIGVPGRPRTESRQQLVLDIGRAEVRDYLFDALEAVLVVRARQLCQVGHEPDHDRDLRPGAATRAPGRDAPPVHPGPVRPVPAAERPIPAHPVRVLRQRRRPVRCRACSPTLPRPGPATTPTPSSGCASSGARRWPSR